MEQFLHLVDVAGWRGLTGRTGLKIKQISKELVHLPLQNTVVEYDCYVQVFYSENQGRHKK